MTTLRIPITIAGAPVWVDAPSKAEAVRNFMGMLETGELTLSDVTDALDGENPAAYVGNLYDQITGATPASPRSERIERTATVTDGNVTATASASIVKNASTGG